MKPQVHFTAPFNVFRGPVRALGGGGPLFSGSAQHAHPHVQASRPPPYQPQVPPLAVTSRALLPFVGLKFGDKQQTPFLMTCPARPASTAAGASVDSVDEAEVQAQKPDTEVGSWWTPYLQLARVDKPTGTLLLAIPCFWGIALATPPACLPDVSMMATMAGGAFLMRGAGCTINDLWDRDIDKNVSEVSRRTGCLH